MNTWEIKDLNMDVAQTLDKSDELEDKREDG
jgi:hypothetical protein